MVITDLLVRNAGLYGDEISLIEVSPELLEKQNITWREYELVEPNPAPMFRRAITWKDFDNQANQFAKLLLEKGDRKSVV